MQTCSEFWILSSDLNIILLQKLVLTYIKGKYTPYYYIDYFLLAVVVRFPLLPVRMRLIYPFKMRMHNISVVIYDN